MLWSHFTAGKLSLAELSCLTQQGLEPGSEDASVPFFLPSAAVPCSSSAAPRYPSLTYPGSIRQQVSIRSSWGTQAERVCLSLGISGISGPSGVSVDRGPRHAWIRGKGVGPPATLIPREGSLDPSTHPSFQHLPCRSSCMPGHVDRIETDPV